MVPRQNFVRQKKIMWRSQPFRHGEPNSMLRFWRIKIRHEIFLWRIWDLQWRISFVTDASISTSVSTTWHAYCNCYLSWPYLYQPLLERTFQASWCAAPYVFFLSPLVGWTDWVLEPDHGKLFCCFLSMPVLRSGCSGSIWLNIGITPPTILPSEDHHLKHFMVILLRTSTLMLIWRCHLLILTPGSSRSG